MNELPGEPLIIGVDEEGNPVIAGSPVITGPAASGKSDMTAVWAAELSAQDARQAQDLIAEMQGLVTEMEQTPWWRICRMSRLNAQVRSLHCEIRALQEEIVHLDQMMQAAR